jgi:hypothetical protein
VVHCNFNQMFSFLHITWQTKRADCQMWARAASFVCRAKRELCKFIWKDCQSSACMKPVTMLHVVWGINSLWRLFRIWMSLMYTTKCSWIKVDTVDWTSSHVTFSKKLALTKNHSPYYTVDILYTLSTNPPLYSFQWKTHTTWFKHWR